jgi:hypothetical protein
VSLGNIKANLKSLAVKFKVTPRSSQVETPKRHILVWKAIIWLLHHENPLLRSGDMRTERNGQEHTKEKKNQQRDKSAIWGKRTGKSRKMPFGKINDLIDVVNYLKFHVNSFSGCGAVNTQS